MIGFLFFLLFLYFSLQALISLLFYLKLWQLKEYRRDRLICHLRTKTGKKQIISFLNAFSWKGFKRPIFTLKAILIFGISVFLSLKFWFFFLKYLPFPFYWQFLLASLLISVFAPILVSFVVFIFQPVSWFLKKIVILTSQRKIRTMKNLKVIGISGSFGKSSTKEILAMLLKEKFKVLKTPKNWNTEIGAAKTILRYLQPKHEFFIVEMGAYKKNEIKAIADLVKPQIGLLTGINEQHLPLFGSLEKIIKAKYELIEALPEKGLAIFNNDNKYVRKLAEKTKKRKKIFSLKEVKKVRVSKRKISFQWQNQNFSLNLLGAFQISNFLGAAMTARELGLSWPEIQTAASKIKPRIGTMKPFIGLNDGFFIDDSYNANPDGLTAALDYLTKQKGRKIVVTRGMIELGKASVKLHRQIGRRLAREVDLVILTKRDPAKALQVNGLNLILAESAAKALEILQKEVKPGDLILLEGRLPDLIIKGVK